MCVFVCVHTVWHVSDHMCATIEYKKIIKIKKLFLFARMEKLMNKFRAAAPIFFVVMDSICWMLFMWISVFFGIFFFKWRVNAPTWLKCVRITKCALCDLNMTNRDDSIKNVFCLLCIWPGLICVCHCVLTLLCVFSLVGLALRLFIVINIFRLCAAFNIDF